MSLVHNNLSWIDLPDDNYIDLLGYDTNKAHELNLLTQNYHGFPKTDLAYLEKRQAALRSIHAMISQWIECHLTGVEKPKHLRILAEMAQAKANYLEELAKLYERHAFIPEQMYAHHTKIADLYDETKKSVSLTHRSFFSLIQKRYWGDFWYESLDPCHRQITSYAKLWECLRSKSSDVPHFFMWLEEQHVPPYVPQAEYFSNDRLESYLLEVRDGLLVQNGNAAHFADEGKKYLFTVNLDGRIFVCEETSTVFHTSLAQAKPVLSAGKITIDKGHLKSVFFESGHYIPSIEIGFQLFTRLKEKGWKPTGEILVSFFYDRDKYAIDVTVNDLENLEHFTRKLNSALTFEKKERSEGCNL